MKEIKVISWINYEAAKQRKESIGGFGGWVSGDKWEQYLSQINKKNIPYYEALKQEILNDEIRVGGDRHQKDYIPLFSDNTVAIFSFRAWGDLLAAIYNTEENTNKYSYMDFYMDIL